MTDLRQSWRFLAGKPLFSLAAIGALALGVGVNTAVFAVVYSLLIKPLPYEHPQQLVQLWDVQSRETGPFSYPEYQALSRRTDALQSTAAYFSQREVLTGGNEPERVNILRASTSLLPLLGTRLQLGAGFDRGVDEPGTARELVLSYDLWRRDYRSDPGVIGRTVHLGEYSYTVVGVLPARFNFVEESDVLMPLRLSAAAAPPGLHFLNVVARMQNGFTPQRATQALQSLKASESVHGIEAVGLQQEIVSRFRTPTLLLFAAACLILLIACVNVANLLLVRSVSRRTELAVRVALGASSRQLARQFLAEGAALAVVSGLLGAFLARLIIGWAANSAVAMIPRADEISLSAAVVLFTAALSFLIAGMLGLGGAFYARVDDLEAHLRSTRQSGPSRATRRWQNAFVAAELALTITLLCGAGLLIRSFTHLLGEKQGFVPNGVLSVELNLSGKYADPRRAEAFYSDVLRRVAALPWVDAEGVANSIPVAATSVDGTVQMAPAGVQGAAQYTAEKILTDGGYFRTLRIPLLAGRLFNESDSARSAKVAIIDETLARKACGGNACIDKTIDFSWGQDGPSRIVGIVGPVRQAGLEVPPKPTVYVPYVQRADLLGEVSLKILVRGPLDQKRAAAELRNVVAVLDKDQPPPKVRSMPEIISSALTGRTVLLILMGCSAGLALVLSILGIYGAMSYVVTTRASEFGLRMALGASRWGVMRLVLGHALLLACVGVSAGVALAAATTRLLAGLLYGTSALDPLTFAAVPILAAVVVLGAALVPALRTLAVQPYRSLKWE